MDRLLSLNAKTGVTTDDQSRLFELSLFHAIIMIGVGMLNLLARPFNIAMPSVFLLWGFVAGIIYMASISIVMRLRTKPIYSRHIMVLLMYFFSLFMWRALQIYWSIDQHETMQETIKTLILLIFVLSSYYSLQRMSVKNLYRLAFLTITTLLFATFLVYLLILHQNGGLSMYGSRKFKVSLTLFGGSNAAGAVVLLLGLWNWVLVHSDNPRYRKTGIFNALLTVFLLVGITSFASTAGYVTSFFIVVIFALWRRLRSLFIPVFVGIVGLAMLVLFLSDFAIFSGVDKNSMLRTSYQRSRIWEDAMEQLKKGAWLNGVGAAAFSETTTLGGDPLRGGVHNALLQSWVEGGFIELSLQIGLYIWLLRMGSKSGTLEGKILIIIAAGFFIRNLAESNGLLFGLFNNYSSFASWYVVIFSIVLVEYKQERHYQHHQYGAGELITRTELLLFK